MISLVDNGSVSQPNDTHEDVCQQSCYQEEKDPESSISFDPPVYRQRYQAVGELINKYSAKKVLDFGCAEGKLLRYLIRGDYKMEHLVGVDIDGELLKENAFRIEPLLCDWLDIRETPFNVSMLQGSISQSDDRFCDYDLISCVEIIEHLIPEHLEQMPLVVFGQLSPKVVIVTTPNADFNVLFPNLEGFRHWDHKFEWTREEFQEWSTIQGIKYGYNVSFQGIGDGPEGMEHLGCCSQMAIFERREDFTSQSEEKQSFGQPYQLIKEVAYPYRESTITKKQKIMYEVDRLLWFLSQPNSNEDQEDGFDDEPKTYELTQLFNMGKLKELCGTIENLRSELQESAFNLTFDGNAVQYSPPTWESDDSEAANSEWNNDSHQACDDNVSDNKIDEDWDIEDNDHSKDICWTNPSDSIYWDCSDDIQTTNNAYLSDNDNNVDSSFTLRSDWVESKTNDDDDNDGDDGKFEDCLSDDGLPWIISNVNGTS